MKTKKETISPPNAKVYLVIYHDSDAGFTTVETVYLSREAAAKAASRLINESEGRKDIMVEVVEKELKGTAVIRLPYLGKKTKGSRKTQDVIVIL